jgi:cell division protein FtsI (penicillin-binding protein 3)
VKNVDPRRGRWIKVRMGILCALLGTGLSSVVASAWNIQVKHGAEWRMIAERQRQRRLKVQPTRGSILDRNGEPVAVSVDVPSVAVNAHEMVRGLTEAKAAIVLDANAAKLASALGLPFADVQAKLRSKRRFLWLKRRIGQEEAAALKALIDPRRPDAIKGVLLEGEGHRFYPGREALWGLVGFVGSEGIGLDGLEKAYDEDLRGNPEAISALRDRKGTLLFGDGLDDERSLVGDDVHLAVDLGLQYQVQEDLDAAIRAFEAKSGSAVVVDPNTGDVLAIASAPAFNPNDYADAPLESRRHHAISDRVEPGSSMKIFTVAAALAEGKLKPNDSIFCENGAWSIGGITIHDTHPEGTLTPSQVLAKSSNICAAKIGIALGEQGLYAAYKRFGFGESTGLGLPGEAAGVLRAKGRPWYEVEVASASFGQGISVTTIQLAMAMAAIANGGRLLEPRLVTKITSAGGGVVREDLPTVKREVVPPNAARLVTEMMAGVVEEGGTGREAHVPGYRVAGKTATAQKADPSTGKYDPDKFVSSFVGFVPAQRPRFVIAIVVDEPWIAHLGGQVAAPVFRRIAMRALSRFGVAPSGEIAKAPISFPLEDPTPRVYADLAKASSGSPELTGPSGAVAAPLGSGSVAPPGVVASESVAGAGAGPVAGTGAGPVAGTGAGPVAGIGAGPVAGAGAIEGARVALPDLSGLSARDAVRALVGIGLSPILEGTGSVTKQDPPAGGTVVKGTSVRLKLEPTS